MTKKPTFAQLRTVVGKTLAKIPPVVFANAITKLQMAVGEAGQFAGKHDVSVDKYPWLKEFQEKLESGLTTRREMSIVQQMINHQKDKTALKSKLATERKLAAGDEDTETKLSKCILALMDRAEGGRDLGPSE